MACVMSFVMTIFIVISVFAPHLTVCRKKKRSE